MEHRTLEIIVMSAKDLNRVNFVTKMDVYVVVQISGDEKQKEKTPVDKDGDSNPTWNFPMKFAVDEAAAQQNRLYLVFKIKCERALGDKDVGVVHVPIRELLQSGEALEGKQQFVSYQVMKPSGKPKGQITFGYKFGEKVAAYDHQPIMAYPVPGTYVVGPSSVYPPPPPHGSGAESGSNPPREGKYPPYHAPSPAQGTNTALSAGYPYPPPQPEGHGYPPPPPYGGYPLPPVPGYGYPPQSGYLYPPVQQQQPPKKNRSNLGLGLGAGLLGGALGGLLIGDMVSDAAAYDAGFADTGFDF